VTGASNSTIFLTVFTGTTVFVLGQIILRLFIEPVVQLRRTIGDVGYSLGFYSNLITNPQKSAGEIDKKYLECRGRLRELSMRLIADLKAILIPKMCSAFALVPRTQQIHEASKELIFLSNSVGELMPKEATTLGSPLEYDKALRIVLFKLGIASDEDVKVLKGTYKVI
jgi:hypothetical protein